MKKRLAIFKMGWHYQFNGQEHVWIYPDIEITVDMPDNVYHTDKSYQRFHSIVHNKFAKEICKRLSVYRKSDYKYFNKIDFKFIFDELKSESKSANKQTKFVAVGEFTDLFGQTKQISSDGTVRIKPEDMKRKDIIR